MSEDELQARVVRLESLITHLEDQYEQLNIVVMEQGKTLARLQGQQEKIGATVREMTMDEVRRDTRKPPHYQ